MTLKTQTNTTKWNKPSNNNDNLQYINFVTPDQTLEKSVI